MISALRDKIDSFLGRGKFSAGVPVMDGPLQPNQRLEEAEVLFAAPALDNLVARGSELIFSSKARLLTRGADGNEEELATFGGDIACIAASDQGALAVGIEGEGVVIRGGPHDGRHVRQIGNGALVCPTSALFLDENTLVVASGAAQLPPSEWKRDLVGLGRTGSVWKIDLRSVGASLLKSGLGYPYGLAHVPGKGVLVSEAWRHRLLLVDVDGRERATTVLDDLPGYPSRLLPAKTGGYWLTVFAPRNQLLEFILGERSYCREMMETVDPAYWIAPTLASRASFKEPLQYGGVKHMGILKPWAPSWSCGLVVLLNRDFQPESSWHSRADGNKHGVTSIAEFQGTLVVGSKGAGQAVALETTIEEQA